VGAIEAAAGALEMTGGQRASWSGLVVRTAPGLTQGLVYRSRHVGGLIGLSGTDDDLSSLAGVNADEVADEASARHRADLNATFDRIEATMGDRWAGWSPAEWCIPSRWI
jgi:hypothetical protein